MTVLWVPAYVAIGSNLDEPVLQVQAAFAALERLERSRLVVRSPLYRSTPLGPQDQPDFINAVAGLLTQLTPRELLTELKQLESTLGRESPVVRWGPRRIDFDLLVHGTQRVDEVDLIVPHPGVPVRNFVLYPLLDIAPELMVPGQGSVKKLAARVERAGLTPIS
jgi:2-amino-4-hydroxy-6-hydroxymethyldihydropteridine diphosphokinase